MGWLSKALGTAPVNDAQARARGNKKRGKAVRAQTKKDNRPNKGRKVSDERGYGAKGGGWW